MRWTEQEYMEYLERTGKKTVRQEKKKSKYNAQHIWKDGLCFDSEKEADYYDSLKVLTKAKAIKGFCRQPEFVLQEGNEEIRAITYRADFIIFHNDGTYEIVDTKGYEPEQWKRTEKMFRLKYPELKLRIVKEAGL